jgi:hypothetical protein
MWVLQADMNDPVKPQPQPAVAVAPAPAPVAKPAPVFVAQEGPVKHCVFCGRGPALAATLRSVTGIVIAFRMRSIKGPFCRDCGTALARGALNRTLLTGWWGLFAGVANLYASLVDAVALGRFRRAPEPTGEPKAEPLKPGASVFKRAGVYVGGVVMAASLVFMLAFVGTTGVSQFNGKCVAFSTNKIVATDTCGVSHDGRVVGIVGNRGLCPGETDATMRLKADDRKVLCIDLDQ